MDKLCKLKLDKTLFENDELLKLFFKQTLSGFFFMMIDEAVEWNDNVNKDKVIDYVFKNQRIISVNEAMLKQYGAQKEDFIGLTPNDLFTHDIEYGKSLWKKFFDNGQLHVESHEKKLDGTDMWIEGDYICIYDNNGRIVGHFGNQHEITKIKSIQAKLEETYKQLHTMMNNSNYGIVFRDKNGTVLFANKEFCNIFNISSPKVIEGINCRNLMNLIKPLFKEPNFFENCTKELIENNIHVKNEQFELIDGRIIERDFTPIIDNETTKGCFWEYRDITKRIEFEEELKSAKEKAEAASIAKGQFLANISHEIKTPMNGMLGYLQLLNETNLDNEQTEFVEHMNQSAKVLLSVISDVLDISKIESGKLQLENASFDLRRTVESVVDTYTAFADKKGLKIEIYISDEVPKDVFGDSIRLRQVIANLVDNAVKFTDEGRVFIEVWVKSKNEDMMKLAFSIKDTGIGISEENINNLFLPFSQADSSLTRKFGGSGLGLSICKNLVKMMGGNIEVTSRVNIGTRFLFTIMVRT